MICIYLQRRTAGFLTLLLLSNHAEGPAGDLSAAGLPFKWASLYTKDGTHPSSMACTQIDLFYNKTHRNVSGSIERGSTHVVYEILGEISKLGVCEKAGGTIFP